MRITGRTRITSTNGGECRDCARYINHDYDGEERYKAVMEIKAPVTNKLEY